MQLFESEEYNERDNLKKILHLLYAKLVQRRRMIRYAITDCFQVLIYESSKFNGVSQLLEILASVIAGFIVPLREEHIKFFITIIIPLHKVQSSNLYFNDLLRCSMLFLAKDSSLALLLLDGILKYWPFANSNKEIIFLQELPEVLEFCDLSRVNSHIPKLFKRVIKCISGSNLQVADRAMCLFENEHFLEIIRSHKQTTFSMLVPIISKLSENHWNKMIQESLTVLKEIFYKIDSSAYQLALESGDSTKADKSIRVSQPIEERHKLDLKWKTLANSAKTKFPTFKDPTIPFQDDIILSDINEVYKRIYDKEKFLYC